MGSLIKELERRTLEHPDKLLFAFLDIKGAIKESYTYEEFTSRTDSIASHIQLNFKLKPGDRVLLTYPPGIEIICAFFSCVKLGLIPVPVYPPVTQSFESALSKMNFIANDCMAAAVLSDRAYFWSLKVNLSRINSESTSIISSLPWVVTDDAMGEGKEYTQHHSDILFLQYTSGSTNDPKGVIVSHDNIIYNCHSAVDHDPIGVSWLPQYHDMGLIGYYLFFVIKGGTTYGFSPVDFIQRPALWLETISKYRATATSAPNFAYDYCMVPGRVQEETLSTLDLSSLSFVMTAAEPVDTQVFDRFIEKFQAYGLKKDSCFAAYGLAEFSLAVSSRGVVHHLFDTNELKNNRVQPTNKESSGASIMSCGKPLMDTEVSIVDTQTLKIVTDENCIGEIWLRGSSKCAGYWGRTELSEEVFGAVIPGVEGTWLRTGDIGFMFDGELYICGRSKDMIIMRGLNYYPQDIEQLLEEDPNVRKGCVAAFSITESGHEKLVAVVGVKNKKNLPDPHELHKTVVRYLGIEPSAFVFLLARNIEKTSSGKIRRSANKQAFLNHSLPVIEQFNFNLTFDSSPQSGEVISLSEELSDTEKLFRQYGFTGSEHQSLGDAGLDSMKLAEFAYDLKIYIKKQGQNDLADEVDLRLLQKIAVAELFSILNDLKTAGVHAKFKFRQAFSTIQKEFEKAEMDRMASDAETIIDELESIDKLRPCSRSDEDKILLTGGTGFFGPFILKSLLDQTKDKIVVLVRAENPTIGLERLEQSFKLIDPSDKLKQEFGSRVEVICGDMTKPKLGMNSLDREMVINEVHTIYNNGALVNYLLDYDSMRQANVGGTVEIIKLACTGRLKVLNHISTTFIFGWSVKDTLFESDGNDLMEDLDFGYSQSKWVSERIVKSAMKKGLKARVFRPALISPSIDGKGFNYDISIRLLAFMLKYGIGTSAKNQVSFTPADIAANNIVAISGIEESLNKIFHVTRDTYSNLEDVTDIFTKYTGVSFEVNPLKDFVPKIVDSCAKTDILFPLLNFLVKSEQKISRMEFKLYDNSNYRYYRDISPFGSPDRPLDEVVYGILKFMKDQNIVEYPINNNLCHEQE